MKYASLALLALIALSGGEHDRGVQLLEQGQFAEAAEAFRAAIEADADNAELHYNLAVALWRSGDVSGAETAAEKAATLSDGALAGLRDGLLGNLRYDAALAKLPGDWLSQAVSTVMGKEADPQAALALAKQAREHYLRAVTRPGGGSAEIVRNLERAQRLIEEIEKKLEEQEKEQEDQDQQQDQDQENEDEQKSDDEKQDQQDQDQKNQDQQQQQEQEQEGEGDPSEQEGEPQPQESEGEQGEEGEEQESPQDEQQSGDQQEQEQQEQQAPAPGEQQEGRELTEEEKKRLLDKLEALEQMRQALRARQKARRPVVEKDW